MAAEPRLAATVLLLRDREPDFEVFMLRRSLQASFMPGAYVYPGGQVDLEDGRAAEVCPELNHERLADRFGLTAEVTLAILVAGVRECFEEAGVLVAHGASLSEDTTRARLGRERTRVHSGELRLVDLARDLDLLLAVDRFRLFAHWITPDIESKRFDTYFLVTRHPEGQVPLHDHHETVASTWIRPAEALHKHQRGEFSLAPPTFRTLQRLSEFHSAQDVLDQALDSPVPPIEPRLQVIDGAPTLLLPGDSAYGPGGAASWEGATRVVLRDGAWSAETR